MGLYYSDLSLLMRVIRRFLSPAPSTQFRMHCPAFSFQNSITNAWTSKSHFLFPSRYCTAMYSYQVPLFSADTLTKHSFQFDQDNPARWMAPASWVFLGKGRRGSERKWCLSEQKAFPPALSDMDRKMLCWSYVGLWAPSDLVRDSESHFTVPWSQLVCRSDVWESGVGLCETVPRACLSLWHRYTIHLLSAFFTKPCGTRPWSGACLSKPWRLYLRCVILVFFIQYSF